MHEAQRPHASLEVDGDVVGQAVGAPFVTTVGNRNPHVRDEMHDPLEAYEVTRPVASVGAGLVPGLAVAVLLFRRLWSRRS